MESNLILDESTGRPLEDGGFEVTVIARLKHAILYRAAKKLGSQRALANALGLDERTVGAWVNLRDCMPARPTKKGRWSTQENIDAMEKKLFQITGKTLDEIFPDALRNDVDFLKRPKMAEKTLQYTKDGLQELADNAERRLTLPSPQKKMMEDEDKQWVERKLSMAMKRLKYRQREMVRLRFGIGDGTPHSVTEIMEIFRISRERVRQILAQALRILEAHLSGDPEVFAAFSLASKHPMRSPLEDESMSRYQAGRMRQRFNYWQLEFRKRMRRVHRYRRIWGNDIARFKSQTRIFLYEMRRYDRR